jgi:hypothetical protein
MNQLSPGSPPFLALGSTPQDEPIVIPKLVKGALVSLDKNLNTVESVIPFQYNPEDLTRTLQVQGTRNEGGARSEVLKLTGPAIETLSLKIEIDQLSSPFQPKDDPDHEGIYPQLSALETLVYPLNETVKKNMEGAGRGELEIVPLDNPMTLLIWGKRRVLPVRITEFRITEQAFDAYLIPIRAEVSLGLRVLSYNDLPWEQGGKKLFFPHHQRLQKLATKAKSKDLSSMGEVFQGASLSSLLSSP